MNWCVSVLFFRAKRILQIAAELIKQNALSIHMEMLGVTHMETKQTTIYTEMAEYLPSPDKLTPLRWINSAPAG